MKVANVFSLFQGRWHFSRFFSHRSTGTSIGTAQGQVSFISTESNIVLYKETTQFATDSGRLLKGYREYLYQYHTEKDKIIICHARSGKDTGLFHTLTFQPSVSCNTLSASGESLCLSDRYQATYTFSLDSNEKLLNEFELKYDVVGPKKHYVSITMFEKSSKTTFSNQ